MLQDAQSFKRPIATPIDLSAMVSLAAETFIAFNDVVDYEQFLNLYIFLRDSKTTNVRRVISAYSLNYS